MVLGIIDLKLLSIYYRIMILEELNFRLLLCSKDGFFDTKIIFLTKYVLVFTVLKYCSLRFVNTF